MYERFTDRACKVVTELADDEASRFNHEYISPEHILLGLLKEGNNVGVHIVKERLGINPLKIQQEIERLVLREPDTFQKRSKLPLDRRAKKVILYSMEEAISLNHNYVGTEHLLLGLLREEGSIAAQP